MWRKIMLWGGLVLGLSLLVSAVWVRTMPDVRMGKRLAENNCGICHDLVDARRHATGPFLWGVVDRPAGAVDFPFSAAFLTKVQAAPFVWNGENLGLFIANPSAFIPATEMAKQDAQHPLAFEGIKNAANRRDVIAYLRTLQ